MKTISAKDLRLGNWVYSSVYGKDMQIVFSAQIDVIWDGIPLSEEWLLKFGFEKAEIGYSISLSENEICHRPKFNLRWITSEFFTHNPIKKPFIRIDNTGTDIFYVHSFQNYFFALTGEELKIKTEANAV